MQESNDPATKQKGNRVKIASAFASGVALTLIGIASIRFRNRIDPNDEIWAIAADKVRNTCDFGSPILFHIDHDNMYYYISQPSRYPGP